jgi:hypothetical protein
MYKYKIKKNMRIFRQILFFKNIIPIFLAIFHFLSM